MKEIFSGDPAVRSILMTQTMPSHGRFRWSVFAVPFLHHERCYLYHYLTKQCLELDRELYERICSRRMTEGPALAEDRELAALAEGYFLVPEEKDETRLYEELLRLLRLRTARTKRDSYTVFTTTACNARCFYCFEENLRPVTMAEETVEETIRFILRTRDPDRKTYLHWMGGEPLAAASVIDRISEALTREGVDFDADMISNGSLMDARIVEKMLGAWRLKALQVSLDGDEAAYNQRKNYRRFGDGSPYRTVMENLRRLSGSPIWLRLRCNVDEENIDSVPALIRDLSEALPEKDRVSFYCAILFEKRSGGDHRDLIRRALQAQHAAGEAGFVCLPASPLHRTRCLFCKAEDYRGSIVISPEGRLYSCDSYQPEDWAGTVWEGITRPEKLKGSLLPEPVSDACRDCTFLPACTSFSGCPVKDVNCREAREARLLFDLRNELDRLSAGKTAAEDEDASPRC